MKVRASRRDAETAEKEKEQAREKTRKNAKKKLTTKNKELPLDAD